MLDVLASSPLLTVFLVVSLGSLLGAVRLGPVRFGAAGALFVGLAIGALDPRLGEGLGLVQSVGLALFVFTIGLAAGGSFFRDLRTQTPLLAGASVLLVLVGALTLTAGKVLGLDPGIVGGLFAGMLTTTPALAAATSALDGATAPAVGYSIAYPVGVLVAMMVLTVVARRPLPGTKDPEPLSAAGLLDITVHVEHPMRIKDIPGIAVTPGRSDGQVRMSYLLRDGAMCVAQPYDDLERGDLLVLVGIPDAVRTAAEALGHRSERHLADERSVVDHRRYVVSDPRIAGRTVAELRVPARLGGIITRIRRGDRDLLALPDMTLRLGDRVRVVLPRERLEDARRLLGDSEKHVTEVDFGSAGLGIALGVGLGLLTLPLPGGAALALGSAAGPLLVGLVLGRLERTGPLVWTMPAAANLTIRQLGLVLFLAAVGLSSGQAFASQAFTLTGLAVALTAAVVLLLGLAAFWALGRALGLSAPRTAGAMAGFVGQPVLLSHVDSLVDDERTESGYSALYAMGIVVKIIVVQVIVAV